MKKEDIGLIHEARPDYTPWILSLLEDGFLEKMEYHCDEEFTTIVLVGLLPNSEKGKRFGHGKNAAEQILQKINLDEHFSCAGELCNHEMSNWLEFDQTQQKKVLKGIRVMISLVFKERK